MFFPKELFEPNPHPLNCCHEIPFVNCQSELARPAKSDVSYVPSLVLIAQRSGDVSDLEKFFNGGEYVRYRVSRIVYCILGDFFALEELVGNQLTIVVLEVSQHVRVGFVDRIGHAVVDIREVRFLDHAKNLLNESLHHSFHLLEQTHFIGV